MLEALIPDNEFTRLQAVRALNILDTTSDIRFDLLTHFASHTFNIPLASISLTDSQRQWHKSIYGANISEIPRSTALCSHAIYHINSHSPDERIFQVNNLAADLRFANHPFVIEGPEYRAYMSYVIQSKCGSNIGTFCVADCIPRIFSRRERQLLISLGEIAQALINSYPSFRRIHSASMKSSDI